MAVRVEFQWDAEEGRPVEFRYDALGRRTAKQYFGKVIRWVWDGNVPIHEWSYKVTDMQSDEKESTPLKEPTKDITTWVFEAGTFVPTAKIQEGKQYSIVSDYLGTPIQMYDEKGNKTWDYTLDVYGKVTPFTGRSLNDCPFRYQGQYEDKETGLYYNRFRYFSPELGSYISQDPIGLLGENPTLYSYVIDINSMIDTLGLKRGPKTGAYRDLPEIEEHTLHHIIPDSLKDHPLLKDLNYDINNSRNLVYLPNISKANPSRTVHLKHGGHLGSHKAMALAELDRINALDASPEIKRMHVDAYTDKMRNKYLTNNPNVKLTKKHH